MDLVVCLRSLGLEEYEAAFRSTVCLPSAERALIRISEALMLSTETGEQWTDAFLHRLRGEVLLKCDPTNSVPAEVAFLTAIAIAREQKARSFELRAALSLAKLIN